MSIAFFNKIESQRRSWNPNNPAPSSETCLWPETISRCLALTDLEPAVADFIRSGLDTNDLNVLAPAIGSLKANITEEVRHELAFTRAKTALKDYDNSFEPEAQQLISAWKSLPDNPITTAAVLENGVFFVILPIYATAGSTSLRITSASVSIDERVHVQVHRAAAQLLKAKPSKKLNELRKATIDYIGSSLVADSATWDKQKLQRNSDLLMTRGVSDLLETQVVNVNAPFELNNCSMDSY